MRADTQILALALALAATVHTQVPPPAPQATFRTGVDLIQVDVSVLDKDRHPVRGLTAADFTLTEDGKPRPIVSFAEVDIPAPIAPPAGWMTDVAPDVVTNTHPAGRLVVIAIDDGALSTNGELWGVEKARAIARAAVRELGADDLAAVVFTEHARTAQNFTGDRARLLAAIDKTPLFPKSSSAGDVNTRPSCQCGVCSIEGLQQVAVALRSVQQQRKTILFISPGIAIDISMKEFVALPAPMSTFQDTCEHRKHDALLDLFRAAQLANVTISAVDPNGLVGGGMTPLTEFLKTVAENTGGRAVVLDNQPERHVPALLDESRSYYLLGFERADRTADGHFHRIRVRVNGRDVEVRARSGYYAPTKKELTQSARTAAPASVEAAIGGQLPKADFPMQVSVAPFADGTRKPSLAVALNVTQPALPVQADPGTAAMPATSVELFAGLFDAEGKSWGTRRMTTRLGLNAGGRGDLRYELLPRLSVPPGHYELRLAVRAADARSGSVYTFVDVPDFSRETLSLSGLVVSATPSVAAAPADAYKDLLPIVPTARREFSAADHVTTFARVYQGGSRPLAPVVATTRIIDARNEQVTSSTRSLDPAMFTKARSFDLPFELPLTSLPAGEYLLTVRVEGAGKSADRTMRFSVR